MPLRITRPADAHAAKCLNILHQLRRIMIFCKRVPLKILWSVAAQCQHILYARLPHLRERLTDSLFRRADTS